MKKSDDENYELLLEQERLLLEATELVEELMADRQVNRSELAERLGKSKPHVTQLLSGDRNLTLRTLAELVHVLGERVHLQTQARSEAPAKWHSRQLRRDQLLDALRTEWVVSVPGAGTKRPDLVYTSASGEQVFVELKALPHRRFVRPEEAQDPEPVNRRCLLHAQHRGSRRDRALSTGWLSLSGQTTGVNDEELGLCSA